MRVHDISDFHPSLHDNVRVVFADCVDPRELMIPTVSGDIILVGFMILPDLALVVRNLDKASLQVRFAFLRLFCKEVNNVTVYTDRKALSP